MKRLSKSVLVLVLMLPVMAFAGDILDGVVATVNRRPVLQSDWDDATRFEAFMQQKPLAAVTEKDRVSALQRLIDRQLLEMQMGDRTSLAPSQEDLKSQMAKLRGQIPTAESDADWRKLLAAYGLSERELISHLRTETEMMNFIEVRLRPTVHVEPEEVEAYYLSELLPDMEKAGVKVVTLQEVSPRIRELLVQQHMDVMLEAWLHNLRQQTPVHSSVPLLSEGGSEGMGGD